MKFVFAHIQGLTVRMRRTKAPFIAFSGGVEISFNYRTPMSSFGAEREILSDRPALWIGP